MSATSAIQEANRRRGNQLTGLSVKAALERSPAEAEDSWTKLSAAGRQRAQALYDECRELISQISEAQQAHVSVLRSHWLKFLNENLLARINNLDSDSRIAGLENVLHDYSAIIANHVANQFAEWEALEHRYHDEHDWLARRNFTDATLAAVRLETLYNESRRWLDNGAANFITREDFSALAATLAAGTHIAVGTLQASRARAHQIEEILDTVTNLRVTGADADERVPGWRRQVENEIENLTRLADNARATAGTDFPAEFSRLRHELQTKLDATLRTHEREKTFSENAVLLVAGVAEGLAAPFVEMVREIVDLTQSALLYVSGGRFQPQFTSALMKAFKQGATRTEIVKDLVTGLIETPVRFVRAAQKGDWENIGKEAANLYMLAMLAKRTPGILKRLPELAALTTRGLRALRARIAVEGLGEGRLGISGSSGPKGPIQPPASPSGFTPREPIYLKGPAAGETPAGPAETTAPETAGDPATEVPPAVTNFGQMVFRVAGTVEDGLAARISLVGKQLFLEEVFLRASNNAAMLNIARQLLKFAAERGATTIRFKGFIIDAALRARYRTPRFDFTVPASVDGLRSVSKVLTDNIAEMDFFTDSKR